MPRVLVTGGQGLVGKALQVFLPDAIYLGRSDGDLRDTGQTRAIFERYQPETVIHLAAKVGGLFYNRSHQADFYYDNIMINTNVVHEAYKSGVKNIMSLLSCCIYPDHTILELGDGQTTTFVPFTIDTPDSLHNGHPSMTNYGYAFAKRMLEVQSRAYREQHGSNYRCLIPCNIYGPHDNFDPHTAHVIPALIRKFYLAKNRATLCKDGYISSSFLGNEDVILLKGTGAATRQFIYSKDVAVWIINELNTADKNVYLKNIGCPEKYSISYIASLIAKNLDYRGEIVFEKQEIDDGQRARESQLEEPSFSTIKFEDGIKQTCEWFMNNFPNVRGIKKI